MQNYHSVSASEAVKVIKSGDHIHISSAAAPPQCLINAMCERGEKGELHNVTIHHLHTEGPAPYTEKKFEGIFQHDGFFVGKNVRQAVQEGFADYISVFLSDTQRMYREKYLPCDVALIQVSRPDNHGYVSLGTSVEATLAAIENAKTVIAVVNPNMPRTFGDALIPMSLINIFVDDNTPLIEATPAQINETQRQIGNNVASLIDDGACLQMGIGAIPNAVLSSLTNHKNLGIHTEMFSDGTLPLIEKGIINGSNKVLDKGKMVATFIMGSKHLYEFLDNNPMVRMMDVGYTNDPFNIARQPRMTAINSALEIDITGQICADSIGTKFFSGVGGQIDFLFGASKSYKGKNIIAMSSTTNKGVSKIVPTLSVGAGCGTPRSLVHYIVTEYGIADVYGKSLQQRARAIINISHPDHREELSKAAFERFGSHFVYISK